MRRVYNARVAFVATSLIILSCFWVSDSVCGAGTGKQALGIWNLRVVSTRGGNQVPARVQGTAQSGLQVPARMVEVPFGVPVHCVSRGGPKSQSRFICQRECHSVYQPVATNLGFASKASGPGRDEDNPVPRTWAHAAQGPGARAEDTIFPVVVAAGSFTDLIPTRWIPLHLGGQKGIVFRRQNGRESYSIRQDQSGRRLVRDRTGFRYGPEAVANDMSRKV